MLGGFVFILFVYGTMTQSNEDVKGKKTPTQTDGFNVTSPGSTLTTEGLTTGLSETDKKVAELNKQIELLRAQNKQIEEESKTDGRWNQIANLTEQVQTLQGRLNQMPTTPVATGQGGLPVPQAPSLDVPLPRDGGHQTPVIPVAESTLPPVEIRVVGEPKRGASSGKKPENPVPYIPAGANFEAVLLNGMDASTAIGANRTPTPALLRVKTEAILPNLQSFNVRECFVLAGGVGNMSSERVELRSESMSCISDNGVVWEGKVEGYLVGEDGKTGARGRLVSKQGALLAKSFMAGFASGLSGAFAPQEMQSVNLTSGSGPTAYQYPTANQVIGSGMSKGLNQSTTALSNFYIKMAEQMFPILELDAGRKMTVILIKGTELKLDKQ